MKELILWTLAFLGLISVLRWSLKLVDKKEQKTPKTSLVLKVHNWEENVERVVRFIAASCYFNNNLNCPVDVVFLDTGSTDQTIKIIRRIAKQFAFIKLIDKLEYTREKCQGDVILYIDTSVLSQDEVEKTIKFYFNS